MQKTSELCISSVEESLIEALDIADGFIKRQNIDRKKAIRLRLLVEETIGLVRMMTGDFKAQFWIENEDDEYRIRLNATTNMNIDKKDRLLSLSTSGKNSAVTGFMSKIADIIDTGFFNYNDIMKDQQKFSDGYFVGYGMINETPVIGEPFVWSLKNYKTSLETVTEEDDHSKEAWDELERSIVASIANDVIVGVKKDSVDLTIIYK